MIEVSGMTQEEFYDGYKDFLSNIKPEKLETGTLLDNILKNGIPKDKITMVVGKSVTSKFIELYIKHLLNSKLITFVIK